MSTPTHGTHGTPDEASAQAGAHKVTYGQFFLIYLGLIALTGLTVALAGFDLGRWILLTAMGIASAKTALVLNIFMHLKFEDTLFRWFVLVAFVILAIFFGLTFFDYAFH
jgi:cytochrome c oxidase subunit 4